MEWKPIARVKESFEVRPHPRDAALLTVSVRLSRVPPPEWQDRFKYSDMHREGIPALDGTTVSIAVSDGQEEAGIAEIDDKIARTNAEYERDDLPVVRLHEQQEKRRDEEANRRLKDARTRLKNL